MDAMTTRAERRADFYAEADRRWAEYLKTGESIPWEDARRYLKALIAGKKTKPPLARKLARS